MGSIIECLATALLLKIIIIIIIITPTHGLSLRRPQPTVSLNMKLFWFRWKIFFCLFWVFFKQPKLFVWLNILGAHYFLQHSFLQHVIYYITLRGSGIAHILDLKPYSSTLPTSCRWCVQSLLIFSITNCRSFWGKRQEIRETSSAVRRRVKRLKTSKEVAAASEQRPL